MKKLVCELCESTEFAKKNGMFVCKGCGAEYSTADAKKLMREVAEDRSAPVKAEIPLVPSDMPVTDSEPVSDEEKLKVEYDLLCWHNFYEKCHELENAEVLKDDLLLQCDDVSAENYPGDISERNLSWGENRIEETFKIDSQIVLNYGEGDKKYFNEYLQYKKRREAEIQKSADKRDNPGVVFFIFNVVACSFISNYSFIMRSLVRSRSSSRENNYGSNNKIARNDKRTRKNRIDNAKLPRLSASC